jgi:hypothetical protein
MPRKSMPRTSAIAIIVMTAFFGAGGRKAVTPFDTTSTPVRAVQPDEKARSRRNTDTDSTAV